MINLSTFQMKISWDPFKLDKTLVIGWMSLNRVLDNG